MSPTLASPSPTISVTGPDFKRDRVELLSKLYLTMGAFFFVASNIHRAVFVAGRGLFDRATIVHAVVLLLQAAAYFLLRRKRLANGLVSLVELGLVVGTLTGAAIQTSLAQLGTGFRVDMIMIIVSVFLLSSRAVIVPSAPRSTLLVGITGLLPALTVAWVVGSRLGILFEAMSFAAILCAATLGLTTFTSRVIYGLRAKVAQARQLGQYALERKIGQGGMGEVYLARHTLLCRPTAVKLLPPERAGAATVARFEREVRETSLLTHPNTVSIYDYGRTRDGVFYYAMEYLDGLDLQRIVDRDGPLDPARVVHVLAQISGALAEAHGRGLVHRDMKPANVLLCERGGIKDTVKVLDFGLVKDVSASDPGVTEANVLLGTPRYLSPEAIRSPELVDARSDLYAVGAIGYFLLTGKDVFESKTVMDVCAAHLHDAPVVPSERVGRWLPSDLEALILACLAKSPDARPPSAAYLQEALLACDVPQWTARDAAQVWQANTPAFPIVSTSEETDATLDARALLRPVRT